MIQKFDLKPTRTPFEPFIKRNENKHFCIRNGQVFTFFAVTYRVKNMHIHTHKINKIPVFTLWIMPVLGPFV